MRADGAAFRVEVPESEKLVVIRELVNFQGGVFARPLERSTGGAVVLAGVGSAKSSCFFVIDGEQFHTEFLLSVEVLATRHSSRTARRSGVVSDSWDLPKRARAFLTYWCALGFAASWALS